MSIFNDKSLKSVADVVSQIIQQEATHPKTEKEKDLAALAEPKDKITHKDVLVGRGVLKKEEKHEGASKGKEEKFHMNLDKLVHKTFGKSPKEMKEGAVPSTEKTIKVKHKTSGKELVVTARSADQYKKQGYHPVKEETELDESKTYKEHPPSQPDVKVGGHTLKHTGSETNTYNEGSATIKAKRHNYDVHDSSGNKIGKITHSQHSIVGHAKKTTPAEHHYSGSINGNRIDHGIPEGKTSKGQIPSARKEHSSKHTSAHEFMKSHLNVKEEVDHLQEYQSKGGVYTHKGTYGKAKGTEYGSTDWDKEEKESKSMTAKKEPVKRGARQNYVRSKRVSGKAYESFSDMIAMYNEMGLKSINEMFFREEPDNEQFTREVEAAKKRANEKKSPEDEARVAKASVQAVKVEEDVEQIDELSVQTMRSAEQKLKHRAHDERMDDNKAGMRHYLGRAFNVGAKASAKERAEKRAMKNEDVEQIDELSKTTLGNYAKRASTEVMGTAAALGSGDPSKKTQLKLRNRYQGTRKAIDKLAKEEVELEEGTYKHEVEKSFPASGVKTRAAAPKGTSTMPKDKEKAKGKPAGSIGEEFDVTLEEGAMKEIHMDIHDHLGKHVSNYKKMGGADHLGNKSTETAKKISKMHNIPQHHAQKLVNDYVDNALKEEVEQIDERTLSEPETQEKERIVKGMKKKLSSFKDRYGDRAKSVMYATATKLAKED